MLIFSMTYTLLMHINFNRSPEYFDRPTNNHPPVSGNLLEKLILGKTDIFHLTGNLAIYLQKATQIFIYLQRSMSVMTSVPFTVFPLPFARKNPKANPPQFHIP